MITFSGLKVGATGLRILLLAFVIGSLIPKALEAAFESVNVLETHATNAFVKMFWENVLCKVAKELI